MEEVAPNTVPERRYSPKQYSLDEFLARNTLPIRSDPFFPTCFPELNYMVPRDFPIDMRIFKGEYSIEDPCGTSTIEEGLGEAYIVDGQGKRIANLSLLGHRKVNERGEF